MILFHKSHTTGRGTVHKTADMFEDDQELKEQARLARLKKDEEEKEARAAAKEAERLRKQKEKEEKERRKREACPCFRESASYISPIII